MLPLKLTGFCFFQWLLQGEHITFVSHSMRSIGRYIVAGMRERIADNVVYYYAKLERIWLLLFFDEMS